MTQDGGAGERKSVRRVLLGYVMGAHGIRGAVLVRSHTGDPEAIGDYGPLESEDGNARFVLTVEGGTQKGLICRIDGVKDRTAAEKLKGVSLYVPRDRLPPAEEGEYYYADLVGLAAVTEQGAALGAVVAVLNFGAGDILEVRPEGKSRTELYPMTEQVVLRVDLDGGTIVLSPPEEVNAGDEGAAEANEGEGQEDA